MVNLYYPKELFTKGEVNYILTSFANPNFWELTENKDDYILVFIAPLKIQKKLLN